MRDFLTFRDFDMGPFSSFDETERDMRHLWNLLPARWGEGASANLEARLSPPCELKDCDAHFLLSFDLPGVEKEDINLEVKGDRLIVKGERKHDEKTNEYSEKRYGNFERIMKIPEGVDIEKVKAHLEDGVLSIALVKAEKVQPKKIQISEEKDTGLWDRLLAHKKGEKNIEVKKDRGRVA